MAQTYNLNHTIKVKLFPEGEMILLNHWKQFASRKEYINKIFKSCGYNYRAHVWEGQMHSFMNIFGSSMAGGRGCCSTEIELLEPVTYKEPEKK